MDTVLIYERKVLGSNPKSRCRRFVSWSLPPLHTPQIHVIILKASKLVDPIYDRNTVGVVIKYLFIIIIRSARWIDANIWLILSPYPEEITQTGLECEPRQPLMSKLVSVRIVDNFRWIKLVFHFATFNVYDDIGASGQV